MTQLQPSPPSFAQDTPDTQHSSQHSMDEQPNSGQANRTLPLPASPCPNDSSHTSHPILSGNHLTLSYPGHPPILQRLSFSIHVGEKVGVIGPNGAGKTTLFMALCGILPLTAGEIVLFDRPIIPGEFRPELGFVFQNPDDQLFSSTVEADVAFGPENMGLAPEEVAARTEAALTLTGMEEHRDRPPHHLSGGEKRMVAIASVLSMLPELIIYDEPSANLDLRARRRLIQFLQNSQETVLVSSHDLEFLLEVCDRVLLLDDGHIVADGDPSMVMGDAALMIAHGLEKPHSLIPHSIPHDAELPGSA